jgi:hypothetical protein
MAINSNEMSHISYLVHVYSREKTRNTPSSCCIHLYFIEHFSTINPLFTSSMSLSSASDSFSKTPYTDIELSTTAALDDLQTDEQRRILDTVAQLRKCGLDSILSLPQLVVCGDQSAGKSSVLEALTEIPFPRNDNLCTRYAIEIDLRRSDTDSLNSTLRYPSPHNSFLSRNVQFDPLPMNILATSNLIETYIYPGMRNQDYSDKTPILHGG